MTTETVESVETCIIIVFFHDSSLFPDLLGLIVWLRGVRSKGK